MMTDLNEMIRTIQADADRETTEIRAEKLAMKIVLAQLLACTAIWQVHNDMSASEFVQVFKREGTNILLADGAFDAHPALEVLRTEAVKALAQFCDPIAKSLQNYEPPRPSTAETPSGDKQ